MSLEFVSNLLICTTIAILKDSKNAFKGINNALKQMQEINCKALKNYFVIKN